MSALGSTLNESAAATADQSDDDGLVFNLMRGIPPMSNSNHVETVTLTIELANGDLHKMTVHEPGPNGDNPRFMAQQVASALEELQRRADDLLEGHGSQIRSA